MIKDIQIRAARALLGWSATELADRAGLSYSTVQRAETEGTGDMRVRNLQAIQETLEAAGVIFLYAGQELPGGDGVRLRDEKPE